jgi:hypothetical protein
VNYSYVKKFKTKAIRFLFTRNDVIFTARAGS